MEVTHQVTGSAEAASVESLTPSLPTLRTASSVQWRSSPSLLANFISVQQTLIDLLAFATWENPEGHFPP